MTPMHEDVEHEDGIVWLEPPERFPYVRQEVVTAGTRRRPVPWRGRAGRVVGYATLAPDAPNTGYPGMFRRRVFWVREYDRSEQPDGPYRTGAPAEAVDPLTVRPGVLGEITERAWGKPFEQRDD